MTTQEMKFWSRVFECTPELSPKQMQAWIEDPQGLKALLVGLKEPGLLNWIGTITTSTTTEPFIAKEKFRKDSKEVKFYGIWDNFTKWFLDGDGKVEGPQDGRELHYGDLTKDSVDGSIIEELGGEAKAETTLSELYGLLQKQGNGEDGVMLVNGRVNIFYIQDTSGVLRAVNVDWVDGGWLVLASPVESPSDWLAGRRIFSGNS